jgi:hypothetical protein
MPSTAKVATIDAIELESANESVICETSQEPLAIIEHLKEEFGDYSDPMSYDWTWRETD